MPAHPVHFAALGAVLQPSIWVLDADAEIIVSPNVGGWGGVRQCKACWGGLGLGWVWTGFCQPIQSIPVHYAALGVPTVVLQSPIWVRDADAEIIVSPNVGGGVGLDNARHAGQVLGRGWSKGWVWAGWGDG